MTLKVFWGSKLHIPITGHVLFVLFVNANLRKLPRIVHCEKTHLGLWRAGVMFECLHVMYTYHHNVRLAHNSSGLSESV